jgi:hypothetical protein
MQTQLLGMEYVVDFLGCWQLQLIRVPYLLDNSKRTFHLACKLATRSWYLEVFS